MSEPTNPAGSSPVERPVRPGSEARWYCLDRDGVAMLCKDEADARAQVLENDDCWPKRAPHRAALLGDVAALAAEIARLRERVFDMGDIGWAGMYGDDNQPTHWMPRPDLPK